MDSSKTFLIEITALKDGDPHWSTHTVSPATRSAPVRFGRFMFWSSRSGDVPSRTVAVFRTLFAEMTMADSRRTIVAVRVLSISAMGFLIALIID